MHKQLFRSTSNRVFGGVCSGLAEYLDIDPVIVRVLFIVFSIGAGVGFLAYIILWIIVPEGIIIIKSSSPKDINESQEKSNADTNHANVISEEEYNRKKQRSKVTWAAFIIIIGTLWLLHNIIPWLSFASFWPLLLIAIGVLIFVKSIKPQTGSKQ